MDPTIIDWSAKHAQIISENSEIPPDITFKFMKDIDDNNKVVAHKIILAMASQVFRNMFFVHNTKDKSANEIPLEDTTKAAFKIMVDAIYNVKPMKESLKQKSIDEIFSVLYLVTKYEIPELELATKECLSSFPITEDNVLEVAADVMEYETTFQNAGQNVLLACTKFLQSKFTDNLSFIQFVAENGDRMATVHKLALLIKDLPPSCTNCGKNPCQHGTGIEEIQFRVGLKVAYNPAVRKGCGVKGCWNPYLTYLTGEVKEITGGSEVQVAAKYNTGSGEANGIAEKLMKSNGKCMFLFDCK